MIKVWNDHFAGNKISEYGLENNRVDYATLSKAFDAVLNNDIIANTADIGYWEQVSGYVDNTEEIETLQEKMEEIRDNYEHDKVVIGEPTLDELQEQINELQAEEEPEEIYQYYIVSDSGADILQEINEIVFYNDDLDMYVWGVTHFGTSWDYVLTNIPCNTGEC